MPFIRLSDDYNDHPKFTRLSDGAFRLWHQGMGFCRKYQTDGLIPVGDLRRLSAYSPKRMAQLLTPWREGANPLWAEIPKLGVKVHDYLQWNLSKEEENAERDDARQRMALGRDKDLREALRLRDGNNCRYCSRPVRWSDRRGPAGGTYDHVVPGAGDDLSNLVIACRGCNGRKGKRTPEQAGMTLHPPPFDLNPRLKSELGCSGIGTGSDRSSVVVQEVTSRSKRPIFSGQKIVVFDWMLDNCMKILGDFTDQFDLHSWFFELDARALATNLVIPKRDGGVWLEAQLVSEALRRGIPLKVATAEPANKRIAGLVAGGNAFLNRNQS